MYTITSPFYINTLPIFGYVRESLDQHSRQDIHNHITAQDYFGTLATVLVCLKERRHKIPRRLSQSTFNKVIDELHYLQQNFTIVEKETIKDSSEVS